MYLLAIFLHSRLVQTIFVPPVSSYATQASEATAAAGAVRKAVKDIRSTVSGMDRRLAFHINIVSENLGKMADMVEEVHEAVIEDDDDGGAEAAEAVVTSERRSSGERVVVRKRGHGGGGRFRAGRHTAQAAHPTALRQGGRSKFDQIISKLHPLTQVRTDRRREERASIFN